jgi:hypothetical protein
MSLLPMNSVGRKMTPKVKNVDSNIIAASFHSSINTAWIICTLALTLHMMCAEVALTILSVVFLLILFLRCRQCKISVKIFLLLILLHHLIECELLTTKNNFLPYTNIFFRSTNTKNSKDIRFFKKHIFSKTCHIFCFLLFLCFWEYFFQIQHQKLSLNKFLNRLQTRKSLGGCASNRIECTTWRSIL